jgi:adenosine deaminase
MHNLLHCHFESGLRALAVACPARLEPLRAMNESTAYQRADPAGRLRLLDGQVAQLTQDQGIFTPQVFAKVVRRLRAEMISSDVSHLDLRIGTVMRRWPWIGSLTDAIETFRAELPGDALTVSFLGAVNLSRPHDDLDVVFGRALEDAGSAGLLAGVDINMRPADLATLDRYLATLRDLKCSGLSVNIHLGEMFGARFSRQVLSRIIPARIGHGVRLLHDEETVQLIREHDICLDMCPVSNTRLGVWDWTRSSPATEAMRLGLPVTINTDDPLLFDAGLSDNLILSGLSPVLLETARLTGNRYRCLQ